MNAYSFSFIIVNKDRSCISQGYISMHSFKCDMLHYKCTQLSSQDKASIVVLYITNNSDKVKDTFDLMKYKFQFMQTYRNTICL